MMQEMCPFFIFGFQFLTSPQNYAQNYTKNKASFSSKLRFFDQIGSLSLRLK